ncbi:hypothetical protein QNM99_24655 [Pseudomonas sp. PCH446]
MVGGEDHGQRITFEGLAAENIQLLEIVLAHGWAPWQKMVGDQPWISSHNPALEPAQSYPFQPYTCQTAPSLPSMVTIDPMKFS